MGNNKVHTKGQLQGKKGNGTKALHPQSRRVKQAARVDLRTKKLTEAKKERHHTEQERINRLLFFLMTMEPSETVLTISEMHERAKRFLARLDDEINKEQREQRSGRSTSKKQQELEDAKARDTLEYEREGLLMPDLTDTENVVSCRYWMEKLGARSGYLKRLRLVRVFKEDDELVVVQEGEKLGLKALEALENEEQEQETAQVELADYTTA